jgi:hypothetical protein
MGDMVMFTNLPTDFDFSRGRDSHLTDHFALHRGYNAYAYVPLATGNVTTDTDNIQSAINSGKHVLLTGGEYYFNVLTLDNANQTLECTSNAFLRGANTTSKISVTASEVSFMNVRIQGASITGTILEILTSRFSAYRLYIESSNASLGVLISNAGLVRLIDCKISGNSGTQTGVGIEIQEGAYLMYFAAVTINHWGTGILVSAPVSVESSVFIDTIFDNNADYGFDYNPSLTGVMYNPSFINCHFEGSPINVHIGTNANIYAGTFQDCRFGQNTSRCFVVDGAIRYTIVQGCFFTGENMPSAIIYELNGINEFAVENLVDFNNYWKSTTLTTGALASSLKSVTIS